MRAKRAQRFLIIMLAGLKNDLVMIWKLGINIDWVKNLSQDRPTCGREIEKLLSAYQAAQRNG